MKKIARLEYYFRALKIFKELGWKRNISVILNNVGNAYFDSGNPDSALIYYFQALKITEEIGDRSGKATALNNIGTSFKDKGQYLPALENINKGLAISIYINAKGIIKSSYEHLSEVYTAMGDYKKALENYKLHKAMSDSIFTEKSSEKIAEMQVKYETEKKEKEIELLKNESIIQSMEMDKQKNYRNLAIISSVFILFVAVLIYIGYRQKNRSNKLLNSLNEMLKQSYEKLSVQAEHLQISKKKLQAANKELEAFSYSVSHDLKVPLRAIDGFTHILMDDYVSKLDDEAQRLGKIIQSNSQKMSQLINDLLTFSRIGKAEMKFSIIDMKEMTKAIYHEVTTSESRKRVKFTLGDLPNAEGDPNLIRQVWINLISNAVKFSSHCKQSVISVTCREEENKLIYCIKDNGAGFDMKYMDKLFGVFQRLHSEKEFKGTGVGLALVQRIIHRHDGEVWAESEVDKGAAFYFSLPH